MLSYLRLLQRVLEQGAPHADRTGVGVRSLFGCQLRFDLEAGFPLLTTKRLHFHSILHELLWFLRGESNVRYLREQGVSIWDEWADEDGELGPVYGVQWRNWQAPDGSTIDQLARVLLELRERPESRRLLVSAWNPAALPEMALPPCHVLFQFYVNSGRLSCHLYQRSADVFLGLPFNIAGYALLTRMVAHACALRGGVLVHSLGDVHLYNNHREQAREQLRRAAHALPTLELEAGVRSLFDFRAEHVRLLHYRAHPSIQAPVAV